eukprot:scaffold56552_cov71-Cyclotella_meneghiniana.AAC.3
MCVYLITNYCYILLFCNVAKDDVKATFAAFQRLDIGNYGTLNSRTIIEGEIWRIRSCKNLAEMAAPPPASPRHHQRSYSEADSLELSHASVQYNPYSYVIQSPNHHFMNPNADSYGSLHRLQTGSSLYDSIPHSFDFEAYERWNREMQMRND